MTYFIKLSLNIFNFSVISMSERKIPVIRRSLSAKSLTELESDIDLNECATLRSQSVHKWYILAALSTLWIASYHCILCIGALEDSMMISYNLTNTEFSLLSTLTFLFAIFGSLFCPKLIQIINLYNTMFLSASLATLGQIIFTFGVLFPSKQHALYIMYLGRICLGIGYGIQNVTIYSTVNVWFQGNKWLSFALNTVNSTYEIGVLTSRYCLVPLYQLTNQLYVPYLIGIAMGSISILFSVAMIFIERHFTNIHSESLQHTNSTHIINLDTDFTKMKQFNIKVWLIILLIMIGWSSCETFGTQITDPFMITFGISEKNVNMLLSAQSICALTIAQLWGWFNSKYGYLSHFLILSMLLMSVGMSILLVHMNLNDDITLSSPVVGAVNAVLIIIVYVVGLQQFFAVSFTCLLLSCPMELSSIVNSVAAIGYMIASVIETDLFGVIADATRPISKGGSHNEYMWSVLMMIAFTFIGLILAIIVHVIDVAQDGPLHERKSIVTGHGEIHKQLALPLHFVYVNG
eukprot:258374_1